MAKKGSPPTPQPPPPPARTPEKRQILAHRPTLVATEVIAPHTVTDQGGRLVRAEPGDWIITEGTRVLDVVSEAVLASRYERVDPGAVVLASDRCQTLEGLLGVGATRTPETLLAAVQRLAHITIGTITIDFTPGQLEEISQRAKKRGQTVEQALRAVVDRIRDEIFWRS